MEEVASSTRQKMVGVIKERFGFIALTYDTITKNVNYARGPGPEGKEAGK
jgi:hypothetical protein